MNDLPEHLQKWNDGGAKRWREEVGPDLLGGYATLHYPKPFQPDDDGNEDA